MAWRENRADCLQIERAFESAKGLCHQAVAAALGDENLCRTGVVLDLLPQPVDVRLQRVRGDRRIVAPNFVQQRLPCDGPAGAVEMLQDVRFLLSKPDLFSLGIEQQLCARAESVRSDAIDRLFALFVAAQMRVDPCRKNSETERLGDMIVRAGFQTPD